MGFPFFLTVHYFYLLYVGGIQGEGERTGVTYRLAALQAMGNQESSLEWHGEGLQGGILTWFKAKYTNSIELVREGKNDVWLK